MRQLFNVLPVLFVLICHVDSSFHYNLLPGCFKFSNAEFENFSNPGSFMEFIVEAPAKSLVTMSCQTELCYPPVINNCIADEQCTGGYFYIIYYDDSGYEKHRETVCGTKSFSRADLLYRSIRFGYRLRTSQSRFRCTFYTRSVDQQCGLYESSRIGNGKRASPTEYPSVVALMHKKDMTASPSCGGTIVSQRHIITATHCLAVFNNDPKSIVAVAGSMAPRDNSVPSFHYGINDFVTRDNYEITVLLTEQLMTFSRFVSPACFPIDSTFDANPTFVHESVDVLGWGSTGFGQPVSKKLLKAKVTVIANNICQDSLNRLKMKQPMTITDQDLCTADLQENYTGSCNYDSGGPVILTKNSRQYLIGIIYDGPNCEATPISLGVNVRVRSFLDWLPSLMDSSYCY